jgi:cytochrome d ubiquinol oxidase subunit I
MSTLDAARLQMGLSLGFHMFFAAIGIGLPLLMVLAEWNLLRGGGSHYRDLAHKWAKATGLLFAVGAVSGTVLSFELGLLWPKYMEITGAAVGHLFALEGFAFFTEAIFIGLYLYGWDRLSPRAHWLCGIVVGVSGAISGVMILGVNAWMQLPIGFTLDEAGRVTNTNPLAIFGTYAWWSMAVHSTLSCYIAVGFAAAGVYAVGYYLRGRRDDYHRAAFRIAMSMGAVAAILMPLSGDLLAKFVADTQPAKFAAMEAHFETERRAPLLIGGWPDEEAGVVRYAIRIPGGLSFLAHGDFDAEVTGLNDIPRDLWPPVPVVHVMFQVMVGIGFALAALGVWFILRWWRRGADRVLDQKLFALAAVVASPLGFVALQAGWMVTEIGRQPWVINGYLFTRDAVTPVDQVGRWLVFFSGMYVLLGITTVALLRYLARDRVTIPGLDVPGDSAALTPRADVADAGGEGTR